MKTNIVKSAVTAIAAATFFWLGTAPMADARHPGRPSCETRVYVSSHCHCGLPLYTERYLIGYDRHGRPIWGYREVRRHTHHVIRPAPCRPSACSPIRPVPYPYSHGGHRR